MATVAAREVALPAIGQPALLQLRGLLRLDRLVLDFAAQHEHELRTDHPLLDRQVPGGSRRNLPATSRCAV